MDFLGRAETFVRIVEQGSLSAAGRSMGLSLAAVSRQITSLEAEVGATLLVRTARSIQLTEEGRRFHEHACRLVREADAARASVRPDGGISGHVVLSASVTLGVLRIAPALQRLLAAHPALSLELRLEDRSVDLVAEGVDLAVRAGLALPDTTNLVAQPLATFERYLVASPAYLRRRGTPKNAAALASHDAVLSPSASATWHVDEAHSSVSVTMSPKLRIGTMLGIHAAVRAGLGIATLPDFVVADDLASGALKTVLPRTTRKAVAAHALYRVEARGAPRIEAIVRHLRESLPLV